MNIILSKVALVAQTLRTESLYGLRTWYHVRMYSYLRMTASAHDDCHVGLHPFSVRKTIEIIDSTGLLSTSLQSACLAASLNTTSIANSNIDAPKYSGYCCGPCEEKSMMITQLGLHTNPREALKHMHMGCC